MSRREGQLFVGRLSKVTRARDLEDIFEPYGRLSRCEVKYGAEMAYAFVDFEDRRDAEDCIKYENGREVCGSSIIVEWAKGSPRRPLGYDECYRCHRPGHWARDCPDDRYGGGFRGSRRRNSPPRKRSYSRSKSRERRRRSRTRSRSRSRDRRRKSRSRDRRSRSRSDERRSRSKSDRKDSKSRKSGSKSRSRSRSKSKSRSRSRSNRGTKSRSRSADRQANEGDGGDNKQQENGKDRAGSAARSGSPN